MALELNIDVIDRLDSDQRSSLRVVATLVVMLFAADRSETTYVSINTCSGNMSLLSFVVCLTPRQKK